MADETDQHQAGTLDTTNLALNLDDDDLKTMGHYLVEAYKADKESRPGFDDDRSQFKKLFSGNLDEKTYPDENSANVFVPMLTNACLQFQARAYEQLIPKEIARCWTKDKAKKDAAERAADYLNFQLRFEMEEWEEDMDAALLALARDGSIVKKTYYSATKRRVVSRYLTLDDFVTSYRYRLLEDCPRKTHVMYQPINEINALMESKYYLPVDAKEITPTSLASDTPSPQSNETTDKIVGQTESPVEYLDRRTVLEMECLLDLNYSIIEKKFLPKTRVKKPYIVTLDPETQKIWRIVSREYQDQETGKLEVMESYTAYTFIPNPESWMGFGFGHLLRRINDAGNTILNELIDAGHQANVQGGLIAKRSTVKRGEIRVRRGVYEEVEILGDDIRKAIYNWQFKEPSLTLFNLLKLLFDYARELTTTADWMSGGMPPSDTAATSMLAVIEQGLKVFSVIQKRCHRSLRRELKKIFILDRQFLDEKVYALIQDKSSENWKTFESGWRDFSSNIDPVPVSDPNITSRAERLIKSKELLSDVRSNPLTAQDPEANYAATKEYYEALDPTIPISTVLKKPQPKQPPDLTPEEENAMILKDQSTPALPQQDHMHHLDVHTTFEMTPWFDQVKPHGKNLHEAHKAEHMSFAYMAEQQQVKQLHQGGQNGPAA